MLLISDRWLNNPHGLECHQYMRTKWAEITASLLWGRFEILGAMAKSNRAGQAAVLTSDQLQQLWAELEQPYRLVTQIAYFTAARVGEVVSLQRSDLRGDRIVYRAANTKTRTTKESIITPQLAAAISDAQLPSSGYLFPSGGSSGHITTRAVDKHLRRPAPRRR